DDSMHFSRRFVTRAVVVTAPVALSLALADAAAAGTPTTWEAGEGLSGLDVLLIFVGIPLGLFVVIALLASINPGKYADSYPVRPKQEHDEEWIGGPGEVDDAGRRSLPAGRETEPGGGASASW
ncbi:MAG: hypothetical protein ACRDO8_02495, partial [Nocardioidaceae bacterium]